MLKRRPAAVDSLTVGIVDMMDVLRSQGKLIESMTHERDIADESGATLSHNNEILVSALCRIQNEASCFWTAPGQSSEPNDINSDPT